MKIGIADYGMNEYYGGTYDYELRMEQIKAIGYDGIERLRVTSAQEAVTKATLLAKLGMDFATCESPVIEDSIHFTAAFRKEYVWINADGGKPLDTFIRQSNYQSAASMRFGVRSAIHNHLGTCVEKQDELIRFMTECPDAGLLLDVGHLCAAGGDIETIFNRYYDRIIAIHLKDWKTDAEHPVWLGKGRFCALGEGELLEANRFVVTECIRRGYNKWILVEQDTHLREPLVDLQESRELIRSWGV